MGAPPTTPSLVIRLLQAGVPPTLMCDLLDPQGMKAALAGELSSGDVARARPRARTRRPGARSAQSA